MSLDPTTAGRARRVEALVDTIRSLDSGGDLEGVLQARAFGLSEEVLEARWMAMAGTGSSVPVLFVVVVMSRLALLFAICGMFADTRTAVVVLLVCTFSIGSALFLALELDALFDGLIQLSAEPLRCALGHMNLERAVQGWSNRIEASIHAVFRPLSATAEQFRMDDSGSCGNALCNNTLPSICRLQLRFLG